MKRKTWTRIGTWLVSASMLVGMVPTYVLAAQLPQAEPRADEGLVLHYDFESLKTGTIVNDVSGNGKSGEVMPRGSGVETKEVEIFGETQTAIVLQGGQPGTGHNYVEMPAGVLNGLDSVTISCWVYVNQSSGYARIWDIGHNTTSYMYLLDSGYNTGHTGYTAALTNSGWGNEMGPEKGTALDTGVWKLTTVTFDGETNTMTMYEDGAQVGDSVVTDADLSILEGSTQNYIGYGQFGNDLLNGMVADFRIYDYAMTEDEVAAMYNIPDDQRVERDYNALTLGDTSALTDNLDLPTTGVAGSAITWETSDADVITNTGVVTRPQPGEADATATLTATISSGDVSRTKEFTVTVIAQPTDEQRVSADATAINLGSLSAVVENILLPTRGALESTITWESSNEEYLANNGTVTRPVGEPVTVTLTATISYGSAQEARTFEVTILPLYERLDIVKAEAVDVTTSVGIVPSLPAVVKVTYEDSTTGMEKVTWPTGQTGEMYATAGTQTLTGHVVDSTVEVTATITVEDQDYVAPEAQAYLFYLDDVSLDGTDTMFGENMGRTLEYLKVMDADRMLYNFRTAFGQDTKGAQPLTGWEEPSGLLRGHSTGHFMSALAQAYASTGDETYRDKLDYMVTEMRKLQELSQGVPSEFETACTPTSAAQELWSKDPSTWGEGFLSAYSPDQFALLEQYTPYATIWAPYYTMHKLLAGFLDSYIYAGNETGLEVAKDLGLWVYDRLSACTPEQRAKMWSMYIAGEYGGMNESMTRLYELTGDERYLETAKMFDNTDFFDGLAAGEDTIQGRHANQHIPQIVGAIHMYNATGDDYYYRVAENFWELVTSRYAYSIGGVGTGERFQDPYEQGANILGNEGRGENCETCAAYNMLKLTRELYQYDPDNAAYMDYYERTVINQILASQSHDTTEYMHNGVTYMLPIDPGQRRDFDRDYGGFTCCNGTGMENHVQYQAATYAKTDDTLYVNLYMPTTVDWAEKGVSVSQDTLFPSETSTLTVSGSGTFTMKLRVPYWATAGFTVSVNGDVVIDGAAPSSYVAIERTWNDGDVVTVNMPYTVHLDKTPDTVDGDVVASLMYGPMVMVAKDTRDTYVPMNWYTVSANDSNLDQVVSIVEPAGTGETPHLTLDGLDFYPMYDAYNYRYHAYVKLLETKSVLNPQWLEEAVTLAEGITEDTFVGEDWNAFQSALSDAKALLNNLDGVTQEQLYNAEVALETAMGEGETPEPTPEANKTLLQKTYDYAVTLSTDGVTDTAKKAFETALTNAKTVLDNTKATQAEVDAAWDALLEGIWGLGLVQGDKAELNLLIAKAEAMISNQDKYVETHWNELVDALAKAKDVAADGDAMEEDIKPVAQALLDAILAQRFKADKSILEDLLGKAEGMDLSGYTAESVAVFRSALAQAQAVMADNSLSEDDQNTVDAAVEKLTRAMDGLTAEGETQPSDTPETTGKPQVSQTPEATDKPENVPQTGDHSQVLLYVAALGGAAALMAGMAAAKRKERQGK